MKIKLEDGKDGKSVKVGSITPLTIAMISLSKENVTLTEDEQKLEANEIINHIARLSGFQDRIAVKNIIDQSPAFSIKDFVEVQEKYLYKYVSNKSSEYYKKGWFQVGTVKYFHKMENEKARDELEGFAFINTQLGNRSADAAVTSGLNYYIFCGTYQVTDTISDYHIDNFGPVLMKIDLMPFVRKIAKRIGALSYRVMRVKYANAKLMRTELPLQMQPESFSNVGSSEMQLYLQHLIACCTMPCLFTKPSWFTDEIEIRIVFEMPYDVNPVLPKQFEHRGLLKHIEFLT